MERKIVFKNVFKEYDDEIGYVKVLENLNFEIYKNEFIGIVGPSGCGKSTVFKLLSGIQTPTSGEVLFNGKVLNASNPKIAPVFQKRSLFPWRTVEENISIGLEFRGYKKQEIKKIVKKAIKEIGLKGFEDYYPVALSGGMEQRVALARVLVLKPEVLLLDEPFTALDILAADKMHREITKIWEKLKCVTIIITHDLDEAVHLCDRVIILSKMPSTNIGEVKIDLKRPRKRNGKRALKFEEKIRKIIETKGYK